MGDIYQPSAIEILLRVECGGGYFKNISKMFLCIEI